MTPRDQSGDLTGLLETATPDNIAQRCHTARRMLIRLLPANGTSITVSGYYDTAFEAIGAYETAIQTGDKRGADAARGDISANLGLAMSMQRTLAN